MTRSTVKFGKNYTPKHDSPWSDVYQGKRRFRERQLEDEEWEQELRDYLDTSTKTVSGEASSG